MQDALREREKEYQKLKGHMDKIKRKALLAPGNAGQPDGFGGPTFEDRTRHTGGFGNGISTGLDVGAVVGGMEASGVSLAFHVSYSSLL